MAHQVNGPLAQEVLGLVDAGQRELLAQGQVGVVVGGQGDVDPGFTATLAQDGHGVDGQDVVVNDQAQRLGVVLQDRPGGGARVLAAAAYLEGQTGCFSGTGQLVLAVVTGGRVG